MSGSSRQVTSSKAVGRSRRPSTPSRPLPGGGFQPHHTKDGLQILQRITPTQPPGPRRLMRVEHEYRRRGTACYLAGFDVRIGRVSGRLEARNGKVSSYSVRAAPGGTSDGLTGHGEGACLTPFGLCA